MYVCRGPTYQTEVKTVFEIYRPAIRPGTAVFMYVQ